MSAGGLSGASTEPGPKVRGGHAHKGSATASCQGHPVIGAVLGGSPSADPPWPNGSLGSPSPVPAAASLTRFLELEPRPFTDNQK